MYYLGGKSAFLDAIVCAVDDAAPNASRVCDLFSGSGVVGTAIGANRPVTAVDIQEYARVLASAQLNPSSLDLETVSRALADVRASPTSLTLRRILDPLVTYEQECIRIAEEGDPNPLAEMVESPPLSAAVTELPRGSKLAELVKRARRDLFDAGLLNAAQSTVTSNFGGIYFSYTQALDLDAQLEAASRFDGSHDTILAAVLETATQIVNTIGQQFAQPIRPRTKQGAIKPTFAARVKRDRSTDANIAFSHHVRTISSLAPSPWNSEAIQGDFVDVLQSNAGRFGCIYADPPYTRDHYSRFYHVLETMCLRDSPTVSLTTRAGPRRPSRGVYRSDRHQSPFSIRSRAPSAFQSLFAHCSKEGIPLVLSYSPHASGDGTHPRVVTTDTLLSLSKRYFRSARIVELEGSSHSKLNNANLSLKRRDTAELLITFSN